MNLPGSCKNKKIDQADEFYASYKYMSLEEYHILITKSEEYMEINAQMRREVDKINQEVSVEPEPGIMEKWKRSHRRSHA